RTLQRLWLRDGAEQERLNGEGFGGQLKRLRQRLGIERRELADLFGVGGKKPARIIKHIEEDGLYSARAYPAGLAALLTGGRAAPGRGAAVPAAGADGGAAGVAGARVGVRADRAAGAARGGRAAAGAAAAAGGRARAVGRAAAGHPPGRGSAGLAGAGRRGQGVRRGRPNRRARRLVRVLPRAATAAVPLAAGRRAAAADRRGGDDAARPE